MLLAVVIDTKKITTENNKCLLNVIECFRANPFLAKAREMFESTVCYKLIAMACFF